MSGCWFDFGMVRYHKHAMERSTQYSITSDITSLGKQVRITSHELIARIRSSAESFDLFFLVYARLSCHYPAEYPALRLPDALKRLFL